MLRSNGAQFRDKTRLQYHFAVKSLVCGPRPNSIQFRDKPHLLSPGCRCRCRCPAGCRCPHTDTPPPDSTLPSHPGRQQAQAAGRNLASPAARSPPHQSSAAGTSGTPTAFPSSSSGACWLLPAFHTPHDRKDAALAVRSGGAREVFDVFVSACTGCDVSLLDSWILAHSFTVMMEQ